MPTLDNQRIAILATNGFEQSELEVPRKALEDAGAKPVVVAPTIGDITGWSEKQWGNAITVDLQLEHAHPEDFQALLLPGGVMSPDQLRIDPRAVAFVRHFFDTGKPVAAICHAPWLLIEADVVRGRQLTSWPSLRTDLENAGAQWRDEAVVVDQGLVTSRQPADLPEFCARMVDEFASATLDHSGA